MTHIQWIRNSRICWNRQDGHCSACGVEMDPAEVMELAHRVPDTVGNRAKYGQRCIDHPDNQALVCTRNGVDGHECNDACVLGAARPVEREALMQRICEKLAQPLFEED